MKIVAHIPVKLRSQRLPGKNIKQLGGKPLIHYVQQTIKSVKGIDEVFVYCSDERIKGYLLDGVRFLKRSPSLDSDSTKINEVLQAFAKDVKADLYVLVHATAPFISAASIEAGLEAVKSGAADSALAVEKMQDFFWQDGKPLNYDPASIPRTQDLNPIYKETCGLYIFSYDLLMKHNRRVGFAPKLIEVSTREAVDIDTEEDFMLAQAMLNANGRGALTTL